MQNHIINDKRVTVLLYAGYYDASDKDIEPSFKEFIDNDCE